MSYSVKRVPFEQEVKVNCEWCKEGFHCCVLEQTNSPWRQFCTYQCAHEWEVSHNRVLKSSERWTGDRCVECGSYFDEVDYKSISLINGHLVCKLARETSAVALCVGECTQAFIDKQLELIK